MIRNIFLILCLSLGIAQLSSSNHYPKPHQLPKKINLRLLKYKAKKYKYNELIRAIRATKAFNRKNKNAPINKRKFLQNALFIESQLNNLNNNNSYLTTEKTRLKNIIEYDPITRRAFIVLDNKKAFLGKGKKKTAYKSILYKKVPQIVARSEQSYPMEEELEAHKALQNVPGVMKTYAFTSHKNKGENYYTIYSDLYEKTLEDLLHKKSLSLRNKVVIMKDLLIGLDSLHSRNYVHRDLHSQNYLIRTEKNLKGKKVIHAVITDLGRTITIDNAKQVPAQMTRRICPPEGFTPETLNGSDYFASDLYALGSIFYRIYHNKPPEWQKEFLRSTSLSGIQKKAMLISQLKKTTAKRRQYLSKRRKHLSTKQKIEFMILKMVHHNPAKRGSAAKWKEVIQNIHNKVAT
jgi:serine/threonine protein kinase